METYRDVKFMHGLATNSKTDYEERLTFVLDEIEKLAKKGEFKSFFKYSWDGNKDQFYLLINKLNTLGFTTYNENIKRDDFTLMIIVSFDISWRLIDKTIPFPPSSAEYKKKYLAWLAGIIEDMED